VRVCVCHGDSVGGKIYDSGVWGKVAAADVAAAEADVSGMRTKFYYTARGTSIC
jgi:hypothetical protein